MGTQTELTALISPLVNTYKAISNEWKYFLEIGLEEYLHTQFEKYYLTNTFIHRSEKVKFKDIYYPIKATYKELTSDFSDIDEILKDYNKITLVGTAGSGKTTLLKYIFFQCIQLTNRIPIVIELRNLNTYNSDFESMISEKILKLRITPTDNIFKRVLKQGRFVFLLDGYDEIFSIKKQEINRQIELFIDTYPENVFLISTRPGSGIEGYIRFYDFYVDELTDNEVDQFVDKIVKEPERNLRIKENINNPASSDYYEYLRNPLLLSMFILAFESHPEIPTKKSEFYWNVFHTLYSRHDGITKNSFPREKLTKLQRDEFESILNVFSYLTLLSKQYNFTEKYIREVLSKVKSYTQLKFNTDDLIHDLRTAISIIILDGFQYSFPHRSLQEYFTAQFISRLPNNKKEKAYNNVLESIFANSNDYSYNLWDLFFEMDRDSFLEYFIIPRLIEYETQLNTNSDADLISRYVSIAEGSINYTKKHNYNQEEKRIRFLIFPNLFHHIIEYCKIYNYIDLSYFNYSEETGNKIISIINTHAYNHEEIDLHNLSDSTIKNKLIDYLCKTDFLIIIKRFKESISNMILYYQNQILAKQNNIDNLLDM